MDTGLLPVPQHLPKLGGPRYGVKRALVLFFLWAYHSRHLALRKWPGHPPFYRKPQILSRLLCSCAQSQTFPLRGAKEPIQGETAMLCLTFTRGFCI